MKETRGEAGAIVPFGKYKGQPAEVMLADESYCKWFLAQPGMKERFGNVYNVIVNYGGEPQDSPEHNEMQARFLDDKWCFRLVYELGLDDGRAYLAKILENKDRQELAFPDVLRDRVKPLYKPAKITEREFEDRGWDVVFTVQPISMRLALTSQPPCTCDSVDCDHARDCPPDLSACNGGTYNHYCKHERCGSWIGRDTELRKRGSRKPNTLSHHKPCVWNDDDSVTALYNANNGEYRFSWSYERFLVECKPSMGDDYPSVLRQVLKYQYESDDKRCVVVRRAQFTSVTWEQVVKIFAASGIALVREPVVMPPSPKPTPAKIAKVDEPIDALAEDR
jgi:hypothetical protein